MRRIDLLIGGVIVLAVVFSFVGVATYEAVSPDTEFDVTWNTRSQDLSPKTETQTGNTQGRTIEYTITSANLTKVDLKVRVSGAGPRAQAVSVMVGVQPVNATAPSSQSKSLAQGPGAAAVEFDFPVTIQSLPNETSERGPDENATLQELNSEHRNTLGSGVWKVTVAIQGGQSVPVVGAAAEVYTITISAKTTTYFATVQPHTPDVNR